MDTQLVRDTLQRGDLLSWYRIERVLGRGGFGITYLATDTNLDRPVAIKEYLPDEFAERDPDNSIRPSTPAYADTFNWGLDRFISEAKTLVKFKHPNIVQVYSVFEQNSTAYLVMEFEQGCDLKEYLKRPDSTTEENLKTIFAPIIEGLQQVHHYGFIHRDIKPANIYVRENGSPVLLDFGSARQTSGDSTRMLTSLVTVGYTPLEQYSEAQDNTQGPWTDIYALGAVLYYAITGNTPVDSTRRGSAILNGSSDPLKPLRFTADNSYSKPFLAAIDWALAFAVADRPQNLEQWEKALFSLPVNHPKTESHQTPQQNQPVDTDSTVLIPKVQQPLHSTTTVEQPAPESVSVPLTNSLAEPPWEIDTSDPAPANYRKANTTKKRRSVIPATAGLLGLALLGAAAWFWLQSIKDTEFAQNTVQNNMSVTTKNNTGSSLESSPPNPAIVTPVTPSLPIKNVSTEATETATTETQTNRTPTADNTTQNQLKNLLSAITSANIEQLRSISDISLPTERLLTILFETQTSIEAVAIPATNADNKTSGNTSLIEITSMTNHSGFITVPARSFKQLKIKLDTTGSNRPAIEFQSEPEETQP